MATLIEQATALFNTEPKAEKIDAYFWALGIRQTCGRCGGSGHYSYCQMYGTKCFGCKGKGEVAAKLTKTTLTTAKSKVDTSELVALRVKWKAQAEAKRAFATIEPRIQAAYDRIGRDYDVEYRDIHASSNWDNQNGCSIRKFDETLFRAQTMNNSLRQGFWDLQRAVKNGAIDNVTALARAKEIVELLCVLHDAWIVFSGK